MAADQRKKRLNAASLMACTSPENNRIKRKTFQAKHHDMSMRPNISLEWDNKKKIVVSKREQIAIAQRHLIPFMEPGPHDPNILVDVLSVPPEIFELENLSEILSYEVWQSHLSDQERSFLSQFLPKETESDTIVRDLLAGDNFHFGNPFCKWGASLCFEKLHPDNVLHEGRCLKTDQRAYFTYLQKYHNDMIENLQMWKKKWDSCKDPKVDIVQNIWSSRKHAEQRTLPSKTGYNGAEENLVATPESCSWVNSEVVYSSDNQNSGMMLEESQRRKDSLSKKTDYYSNGLKANTVAKNAEKIQNWNIRNVDGAKYMSYIKVSKEQHERIKSSMKHTGHSIMPRSLNNVLGSIDTLNVQPFERFEEEERKKLHDHWLSLATRDIPEGFIIWRKREFQRQELRKSLGEEIGQRLEHQEDSFDNEKVNEEMQLSDESEEEALPSVATEDSDKQLGSPPERSDNEEAIHETVAESKDEKEITSSHVLDEHTEIEHQIHGPTEVIEDKAMPSHVSVQDHNENQIASQPSLARIPRSTMVTLSSPGFLQDQNRKQQQQQQRLDCNPHTNSMEMNPSDVNARTKTDENPMIVSQYQGNLNHVEIPVNRRCPLPSTCDVWPVGDIHGSYYQSTSTTAGYGSTQEFPIGIPQFIPGQEVQMLGLETHRQNKDTVKEILHRQPDGISFFGSYPSQEQNELLQSVFKGQSNSPYHQQRKHTGLEFQVGTGLMAGASQFPGHFRDQVHPSLPLDPRQKRLNDLYMNHVIPETIYPGVQFPMPRQEGLPVNVHDWEAAANNSRVPIPSQPSDELSQNWCAGETGTGTRSGWPSFDVAGGVNHNFSGGTGSNSDQTLFSVLSECNKMKPHSSYVQPGNYNAIAGGIPLSGNFLQQSPNQAVNYLNGGDAGVGIKMNNLGWISMQQQQQQRNSGNQGSADKLFPRSWHH